MRWRSEFALPVKADKVPTGPDWFHEIKHDGYRMMGIRERERVRLITKGGLDWTERYPWIVETARKLKQEQFVLDGEAVVLNVDAMSDFDALHSRRHDHEVQLYAFDMLAGDGDDYRRPPLSLRKTNLARLLARRSEGIHAAPYEQGEIGPDLFRHACLLGLEGIISKHRERAYGADRCTHWIKVKNPKHPAYWRVQDQF
jgi:bifunctional non-homologous end joining protein LigD